MPNTSATGGPLLPSGPDLATDLDFDRVLARLVGGITGLAPGMVRPRWQEDPPDEPPKDEDWCAVGVMRTRQDGGTRGSLIHDPAGDGTSTLRRYEILEVMASFYGPAATGMASLLRDGLTLGQNTEILFHAHAGLVDVGDIVPAPALVNTTWRRRQDITFRIRRRVDRTFPIRNLLSAGGDIRTEATDQTWSTGE